MNAQQDDSDAFDLFAPETLINPYPTYQRLRSSRPVYLSQKAGFWVVTSYRDVQAALREPRLSSNRRLLFEQQLQGLDSKLVDNFIRLTERQMSEKDAPLHTILRKIANAGFTARALASWRTVVDRVTQRLLDEVQTKGRMDIVCDLSHLLSARIICDILGIPEPDRPSFLQWAVDLSTFWGAPAAENVKSIASRADAAAERFQEFFEELIEQRRRRPGEDMVSLLIPAYEEIGADMKDLPALCVLILIAGWLTTSDQIPNGVHALLQSPSQWNRLIQTPALMDTAIEEIMRYDTSLPFVFRVAKEDLKIEGNHIPAGSAVGLGLAAANHDPEIFVDPETFDVGRFSNPHLSFGHGVHFCLGVVLARMELTACFQALVRRMPRLRLDPERPPVPRATTLVYKGFESLPVLF